MKVNAYLNEKYECENPILSKQFTLVYLKYFPTYYFFPFKQTF